MLGVELVLLHVGVGLVGLHVVVDGGVARDLGGATVLVEHVEVVVLVLSTHVFGRMHHLLLLHTSSLVLLLHLVLWVLLVLNRL